jgi:hypothetical protein
LPEAVGGAANSNCCIDYTVKSSWRSKIFSKHSVGLATIKKALAGDATFEYILIESTTHRTTSTTAAFNEEGVP